jgi:Mn-dependent DtxR family transcriptional regulator
VKKCCGGMRRRIDIAASLVVIAPTVTITHREMEEQ